MTDYQKITKSIYFQRCLAIWKSIENKIQVTCALNYTDLAVYALEKELEIPSKESENFKTRFICHILAEEGLPVIAESTLKSTT